MNPRQRRGVLLMIIALIGAIAVFFTVFSYVNNLRSEIGTTRTALRLTEDVPAYQPITEDMYEAYEVPTKFFDEEVFIDVDEELSEVIEDPGRQPVSAANLEAGTLLQQSMVIAAPELESGEREIAIMVDAETGVAGKVDVQSRVDVYAAFQPGDEVQEACAYRVLTNMEVLEVGEVSSEIDETTGGTNPVVPVTFRLTPEETLNLTYAEAFASKLRLSLVSPEGSGDPGNLDYCTSDQIEAVDDESGNGGNDNS
ncbi:Flp pilus assembly protein CpaB [Halostreptopolyspora alba]|uniref:Flp pilus assembly protein CpaB n=1 Tax=Halostreptopolyspora alba TaxID=2487137 RepID=A0A3N0E6N7_9ACTN|nr:Flp pilus assembly protein CpaB [Nocardiopsaceae bacterium YIM 96095]